ncbi:28S ribosomal protein S29, mitochondrial, partial [Halocaridina rubra]
PKIRRKVKEVIPSTTNPGNFDHPSASAMWLQQFRSQNSDLLKDLQLTTGETYTWSRREATEAGSSIMDLVEHGINRSRYSTDAVAALTKELKRNALEGRCKLAFVVDGMNSFFTPGTLYKVDGVYVGPEKFTFYQAFMHFLQNDWKNGVIVGTVDLKANEGNRRESYLPRYLLHKKGWETLDPFVPIPVKDYNEREMSSVLDYYTERNWIQTVDGTSEEARQELTAYSNHNPRSLMEICRSL